MQFSYDSTKTILPIYNSIVSSISALEKATDPNAEFSSKMKIKELIEDLEKFLPDKKDDLEEIKKSFKSGNIKQAKKQWEKIVQIVQKRLLPQEEQATPHSPSSATTLSKKSTPPAPRHLEEEVKELEATLTDMEVDETTPLGSLYISIDQDIRLLSSKTIKPADKRAIQARVAQSLEALERMFYPVQREAIFYAVGDITNLHLLENYEQWQKVSRTIKTYLGKQLEYDRELAGISTQETRALLEENPRKWRDLKNTFDSYQLLAGNKALAKEKETLDALQRIKSKLYEELISIRNIIIDQKVVKKINDFTTKRSENPFTFTTHELKEINSIVNTTREFCFIDSRSSKKVQLGTKKVQLEKEIEITSLGETLNALVSQYKSRSKDEKSLLDAAIKSTLELFASSIQNTKFDDLKILINKVISKKLSETQLEIIDDIISKIPIISRYLVLPGISDDEEIEEQREGVIRGLTDELSDVVENAQQMQNASSIPLYTKLIQIREATNDREVRNSISSILVSLPINMPPSEATLKSINAFIEGLAKKLEEAD